MTKINSPQIFNLFKNFAKHWNRAFQCPLAIVNPLGEILTAGNNLPPVDWPAVVAKTSPHTHTFFTFRDWPILSAPLRVDNQVVGYLLAIDAKEQNGPLLAWGAETIAARLVDDLALQDMTDELIGAWNQLELVFRVTQNLALTTNLMAALESILQEIKKVINAEAAFILLKRPANGLECVTCCNPLNELHSHTLLKNVIQADHVTVCDNTESCQAIWPEAPPFVSNLLATALPVDDDAQAVVGLYNKVDKYFTAGDAKLLSSLASQVGIIIKNFLLHQNLISEERLSRELEIAAEIQKSLLPTNLPQVGGLSIAVSSVPASEVGGDFYDFVTVNDRKLTIVMGDVAGKGIPAAMLTSVTRTMLRVEAMRGEPPHSIIQQANNVLYQDLSRADSFVTVFVATIDTFDGTLSYASAGHMPALLWQAKTRTAQMLKATSPPIGIMGYQPKVSQTVAIGSGDTLLLYTDGITEAQAPNGSFFGLNRLLYIMESRVSEPPERLQEYIQAEIASFRRDSQSRDDATLLILKILPQSEANSPKNISTIIKTVNFSYPADIHYLGNISEEVTASCRQLPALPAGSNADDFIYLIELAISEICTNVIKHAYADCTGEISGYITLLNNGVQLDFYDQGESFDPNTVPAPTANPHHLVEGGYGLHIVRQIMDVVSYEHDPDRGNHWHLIKFLPPG